MTEYSFLNIRVSTMTLVDARVQWLITGLVTFGQPLGLQGVQFFYWTIQF